jgi:hypothetical protein
MLLDGYSFQLKPVVTCPQFYVVSTENVGASFFTYDIPFILIPIPFLSGPSSVGCVLLPAYGFASSGKMLAA